MQLILRYLSFEFLYLFNYFFINRKNLMMIPRRESGYEFAIRTPCTPARWNDFDTEMSQAWEVCHSYLSKLELSCVELMNIAVRTLAGS